MKHVPKVFSMAHAKGST